MIKGVNKRIVEINNPQNEYFEKAILYIRPSKQSVPQKELNIEAMDYLNRLGRKKATVPWGTILTVTGCISAIGAVVAGILISI